MLKRLVVVPADHSSWTIYLQGQIKKNKGINAMWDANHLVQDVRCRAADSTSYKDNCYTTSACKYFIPYVWLLM